MWDPRQRSHRTMSLFMSSLETIPGTLKGSPTHLCHGKCEVTRSSEGTGVCFSIPGLSSPAPALKSQVRLFKGRLMDSTTFLRALCWKASKNEKGSPN